MPATKKKANCSVCGVEVKLDTKFKADYKGRTYYLCSSKDKKEFQNRPQVYAGILRVSKIGKAA
jgi:YHS domain-containing protein